MLTKYSTIDEFITAQENAMSVPISVISGWEWSFKEHTRLSTLYKNSQFSTGNSESERDNKPFKNIIKPILHLQYRAEDIDVKDIQLYVDDPDRFHLSFLIKKYHDDVFVIENDLDTFFDELKESKIDFGGGLSKKLPNQIKPEVIPLQSIAFCDQTNLLGGPIGFKHFFSPDELRDMTSKGWGNKENGADATVEEVITLSEDKKDNEQNRTTSNKTPGKYIEVYEVHGVLPLRFLEETDKEDWMRQMQIVTFYKDKDKNKHWLTLFKGKEKESPFKFVERDKIYGRALGIGGVEELFDAQVWTNYDEIRMKSLLDAAATVIMQTTDPNYANRNNLRDMENLEVTTVQEGSIVTQVPTAPIANLALFERSVREWQEHAQLLGSATDPLLGKSPPSGTPFRLQERVVFEGKGIHDYRRGRFAKHIEEIYKDWIIPYIAKKITQGVKFLSELTLDELQEVADKVVQNQANKMIKEKILSGEIISFEEIEEFKTRTKEEFLKNGNKRFLEILKDELKSAPIKVKINVAGKQKDLVAMVDKLVNIFRQIMASPQVLQIPYMAKLLNQILESSGLSPIDFGATTLKLPSPQGTPAATEPMANLTKPRELALT